MNLPKNIQKKFEIHNFRGALPILKYDHPKEYRDILEVLNEFMVTYNDILTPGGGESPISKKFNSKLRMLGWEEKKSRVKLIVDEKELSSNTHKVDNWKNYVAVEFEWNNKTEFYDRDLNNFKLLHELNVIEVGIIVTRADELQLLFNKLGVGTKYGPSTTHAGKLIPRIERGAAAQCPILVFAIKKSAVHKK